MATEIMEAQLRAALDTDARFVEKACRTHFANPSGVAIECNASEIGIWHWTSGRFEFHVADSGPVMAVDTVAEAVRYTRERLPG